MFPHGNKLQEFIYTWIFRSFSIPNDCNTILEILTYNNILNIIK